MTGPSYHCKPRHVARLSVNVNKIATLRNARGGNTPDMLDALRVVLEAGATGVTIHPREDQRHITAHDIETIAAFLAPHRDAVEFNIEGDPRPELMDTVLRLRPHQCTLVPVKPGEVTSQAGWPPQTPISKMRGLVDDLKGRGIRVSVFVDPERAAIDWAAELGADRIELYTEPYARAFAAGPESRDRSYAVYAACAAHAAGRGLGVNAGHDLDLSNLPLFSGIKELDEVSIGHALVSRAVFFGLKQVVREYLDVLTTPAT